MVCFSEAISIILIKIFYGKPLTAYSKLFWSDEEAEEWMNRWYKGEVVFPECRRRQYKS